MFEQPSDKSALNRRPTLIPKLLHHTEGLSRSLSLHCQSWKHGAVIQSEDCYVVSVMRRSAHAISWISADCLVAGIVFEEALDALIPTFHH